MPDEKSAVVLRKNLIRISFSALFAALIAAGAFVAVPIGPVPVILQNLLVLLSGLTLGPVMGGAAVALYLLAGILGLPVFAGGTGGIARLAGPTGGFLIGYLLTAILSGLIAGRPKAGVKVSTIRVIIAAAAGILIVYAPGLLWLKIQTNNNWGKTLALGIVPFLPADTLKVIAAALIAPRLRRTAADILDS
ncbi:MAG: biotin transporter BioY [Treponema sp.]|jgi:biotin transport system substrate-specific component|nr:biotin transporter BioY [Treponema sp.]